MTNQATIQKPPMRLEDQPDILSVEQMCEILQISTKTGYGLIRQNEIEALKVGRAYRIPKVHLLRYLNIETKII